MEEEKTGKWLIVVIVLLLLWLLLYLCINGNRFNIKSRYFWWDNLGDVGKIFSFFFDDWDDSVGDWDDNDVYWDDNDDYWYRSDDYWDDKYEYISNWWYQRENVPDRMIPVVKWKSYYYADDYDNPPLSKVMREMKLRATYCPYVFCQTANDSWEYVNLKHYYWDEDNEKMILLPNVYYISDCLYYDDLFKQGKLQ